MSEDEKKLKNQMKQWILLERLLTLIIKIKKDKD